MDMSSKEQYLAELRGEYRLANKPANGRLLDEAQKRTRLSRKHLIVKLGQEAAPPRTRRRRRWVYDGPVTAALAQLWALFEYPCGQRLAPLLRD